MMDWNAMADRVLDGQPITKEEALDIVNAPDEELLAILHAAFKVRSRHHGRKVRVHVLQNAKSGVCPEDCKFCSQSLKYNTDAEQYTMQQVEDLVQGAKEAYEKGAVTYCMVTATRGPNNRELETICEATRQIKEKYPVNICASLGLLKEGQAETLREAGVDRYNHNLETSAEHFENVVSTHTFQDRLNTVKMAKDAGMETCCGGIIGMGEQTNDWVELAFTLREVGVESVPLNFLNPRPGTPLGDEATDENGKQTKVRPQECLKALAMFRFVHPDSDVRVAGGREVVLGHMQPMALYAANSLFTEGYLTTDGQGNSKDYEMITQAGFEPEVVEA
ncbi:MAG: biotin synthase BioB [Persicimonas sp.]